MSLATTTNASGGQYFHALPTPPSSNAANARHRRHRRIVEGQRHDQNEPGLASTLHVELVKRALTCMTQQSCQPAGSSSALTARLGALIGTDQPPVEPRDDAMEPFNVTGDHRYHISTSLHQTQTTFTGGGAACLIPPIPPNQPGDQRHFNRRGSPYVRPASGGTQRLLVKHRPLSGNRSRTRVAPDALSGSSQGEHDNTTRRVSVPPHTPRCSSANPKLRVIPDHITVPFGSPPSSPTQAHPATGTGGIAERDVHPDVSTPPKCTAGHHSQISACGSVKKMLKESRRGYDSLSNEERRLAPNAEVPLWMIIRADALRSQHASQRKESTATTISDYGDGSDNEMEAEACAASWARIGTLHPITAIAAVVLVQIIARARRAAGVVAQKRRLRAQKRHQFPEPESETLHHTLAALRKQQARLAHVLQSQNVTWQGGDENDVRFSRGAPRVSMVESQTLPTVLSIDGIAVVDESDEAAMMQASTFGSSLAVFNSANSGAMQGTADGLQASRYPSMRLNQSIKSFRMAPRGSIAGLVGSGASPTHGHYIRASHRGVGASVDLGSSASFIHSKGTSNVSSLRRNHHNRAAEAYRNRRRSLMAEGVDENIIKENAAYCLNRFFRLCAQRWKYRMRREALADHLEEMRSDERASTIQAYLHFRKTSVVYCYKVRHRNRNVAASRIQRAFRLYLYRNQYLERLVFMEAWHEQRVQLDHERDACRILLSVMIMQRSKNIVSQRKKLLAMKHSYREDAERRQRAQELMATLTSILTSIVRRIKRSNAIKRRNEARVRQEREQEKRIRVLESVPMVQKYLLSRKSGFARRQKELNALEVLQEQMNHRTVMLHRVITDAISRASYRRAQAVAWAFFVRCPTLWRRRVERFKHRRMLEQRIREENVAVIQAYCRARVARALAPTKQDLSRDLQCS